MISVVGKLLGRPEVLTRSQRDIPPVRRVRVSFEGVDGVGQITGCELFAKDSSAPLESDDAELLLETRIPVVEGMEPMPLGHLTRSPHLLPEPQSRFPEALVAKPTSSSPESPTGGPPAKAQHQ